MRIIKQPSREPEELPELKKGTLLLVKTPPYYEKEYLYEIASAGEKQIRANLYKSPTVKKSWGREEFDLLMDMGMVRIAPKDYVSEKECDSHAPNDDD